MLSYYPAPAKLNLFLHVLGRRTDGYHQLQSVFRFIDHGDRLAFALRQDAEITRQDLGPELEAQDLCVRAARLLQQATGCEKGVDIMLDKRLPVGAGLGGGSSDAATTLTVLNKLWGLGLSRGELMHLALRLGADVPVFIFGQNAFAEGIGEELTPICLAPAWYVVLQPEVVISTKEIFASSDLTRDTKPIKIADFLERGGQNDLEPVVCRKFPEVAKHLQWLKQFGDARLTGSGACVFAAFPTDRDAFEVFTNKPPAFKGFVAKGLDHHPLQALGFL